MPRPLLPSVRALGYPLRPQPLRPCACTPGLSTLHPAHASPFSPNPTPTPSTSHPGRPSRRSRLAAASASAFASVVDWLCTDAAPAPADFSAAAAAAPPRARAFVRAHAARAAAGPPQHAAASALHDALVAGPMGAGMRGRGRALTAATEACIRRRLAADPGAHPRILLVGAAHLRCGGFRVQGYNKPSTLHPQNQPCSSAPRT